VRETSPLDLTPLKGQRFARCREYAVLRLDRFCRKRERPRAFIRAARGSRNLYFADRRGEMSPVVEFFGWQVCGFGLASREWRRSSTFRCIYPFNEIAGPRKPLFLVEMSPAGFHEYPQQTTQLHRRAHDKVNIYVRSDR